MKNVICLGYLKINRALATYLLMVFHGYHVNASKNADHTFNLVIPYTADNLDKIMALLFNKE